jgi:hypothetical protein
LRELEEVFPKLVAKLGMDAALHTPPAWQGAFHESLTRGGEADSPFAAIPAPALFDPAVAFHYVQRSRQCGAVHRKDLTQKALRYFAGERKGLEDGELGGA